MAILTVGSGQTYSTINAAITASSDGDTIRIYDQALRHKYYNELLAFPAGSTLTFIGMEPGIVVRGFGTISTTAGKKLTFQNLGFQPGESLSSATAACDFDFISCCWNQWVGGNFKGTTGTCRWMNSALLLNCLQVIPVGSVASYYNCFVGYYAAAAYWLNPVAGSTINIYNCLIAGTATLFNDLTGRTLNEDYNVSVENSTQLTGTHDTINAPESILSAYYNSGIRTWDYRCLSEYEYVGTTNANGLDLTTLYTTDLDGRARATTGAGYAAGCTRGYIAYELMSSSSSHSSASSVSGQSESSASSGSSSSSSQSSASSASSSSSSGDDTPISNAVLTVTNNGDLTVTYTITETNQSAVNMVYYFGDAEDSTATTGDTITGNGGGPMTLTEAGDYWFYVLTTHNSETVMSNIYQVSVTDNSNTVTSAIESLIQEHGESMTIERKSESIGTRGERTETWTADGSSIYGWKQPISSQDRIAREARGLGIAYKVFVATNPSVTQGDRLDIGGTKYLITSVVDQAGLEQIWRLDCEEVK